MDPLTAFGLAANVAAFVSFASELIKAGVEIYSSASGFTDDVRFLENVYGDLSSLSSKLQVTCEYHLGNEGVFPVQLGSNDDVKQAAVAVKKLAESCKKDCDELLKVTVKLRLQEDGGRSRRRWDSFRVAIRQAWEQNRIDAIEDRLLKTQVALTLHICTISSQYQQSCREKQQTLQARCIELQLNQDERLREVKNSLSNLERMIQDIREYKHPTPIEESVETLEQHFRKLSISQIYLSNEQCFLSSLQFDARPLRHRDIPAAHEHTFRWLLDDEEIAENRTPKTVGSETNEGDSTTLVQWLKSRNGIFWVSGKPGSGKSTLMKFIADAPRTYTVLSQWASPVVVAAHYFWNAGSKSQKSQEGLLRTLLYDVFRQQPRLIPISCQEKWRELSSLGEFREAWSLSSLNEALSKIAEEATEDELNFCFFIDGLDEFEGDYDECSRLCQTMCTLAASPRVKICLSSRPWNVFEEAFSKKPKIYIHDLTRNDIRNYAASRLQEHPRWPELSDDDRGQWCINEIAERSSGVFLWVFLVTKLLREGMTNRDRFPDLRRRLESFPLELGDFFQRILDSVEEIYHPKMATIFQIALAAKEPLDILIYDFHDLEHDDEEYFLSSPSLPFTKDEYADTFERTSYHLNSRTRGLLEISPPSSVTFLHRTVKDYLTAEPLSGFLKRILLKRLGPNVCPELSILRAYAAWAKRVTPQTLIRGSWAEYTNHKACYILDEITPGIQELTKRLIPYAAQLDTQQHVKSNLKKVLDDIDRNIEVMLSSTRTLAAHTNHCAWHPKSFFREHLVEGDVTNYISIKEAADPVFASDPWLWERFQWSLKAANKTKPVEKANGSGMAMMRLSSPKPLRPARSTQMLQKARKRRKDRLERHFPMKSAKRRRQDQR